MANDEMPAKPRLWTAQQFCQFALYEYYLCDTGELPRIVTLADGEYIRVPHMGLDDNEKPVIIDEADSFLLSRPRRLLI